MTLCVLSDGFLFHRDQQRPLRLQHRIDWRPMAEGIHLLHPLLALSVDRGDLFETTLIRNVHIETPQIEGIPFINWSAFIAKLPDKIGESQVDWLSGEERVGRHSLAEASDAM